MDAKECGLATWDSTHSLEELDRALALKPSYVALGPIFETTCKSMAFGPQGIPRAGDWVRLSPVPVVAIGGLKPEHVPALQELGVNGVALISDVTAAPNPEARAENGCNWCPQNQNSRPALRPIAAPRKRGLFHTSMWEITGFPN